MNIINIYACSKITIIIQRKVHFLYAKNLPAELPGYGLDLVWPYKLLMVI